jgi:Integrase core domain
MTLWSRSRRSGAPPSRCLRMPPSAMPLSFTEGVCHESQFRTLKYRPEFPDRFGCIQDSRAFSQGFFRWYNEEHRHSGLGLLTPAMVHYGQAESSCGNARKCSMLPTNVTRSASYEALPNHRRFPAKSGSTSRFLLRNRCLWEAAEAISCQQRPSLEKAGS